MVETIVVVTGVITGNLDEDKQRCVCVVLLYYSVIGFVGLGCSLWRRWEEEGNKEEHSRV